MLNITSNGQTNKVFFFIYQNFGEISTKISKISLERETLLKNILKGEKSRVPIGEIAHYSETK